MKEHENAEILRGLADGMTVVARCIPWHPEFLPLSYYSDTPLRALFIGSSQGLELQGKWEFAFSTEDEESDCQNCAGTGEGAYDGQPCSACHGRGH